MCLNIRKKYIIIPTLEVLQTGLVQIIVSYKDSTPLRSHFVSLYASVPSNICPTATIGKKLGFRYDENRKKALFLNKCKI